MLFEKRNFKYIITFYLSKKRFLFFILKITNRNVLFWASSANKFWETSFEVFAQTSISKQWSSTLAFPRQINLKGSLLWSQAFKGPNNRFWRSRGPEPTHPSYPTTIDSANTYLINIWLENTLLILKTPFEILTEHRIGKNNNSHKQGGESEIQPAQNQPTANKRTRVNGERRSLQCVNGDQDSLSFMM